jgi:hypothetical protein
MITQQLVATTYGAPSRVRSVVPAVASAAWTQRPLVGGFGTDHNSTRVSAVEHRHR